MKKYAVTGPSCSGKTRLIKELGKLGFYTARECAAEYILEQKAKGIEKPWLVPSFQPEVLKLHLAEEEKIPLNVSVAFVDRGIHDALAFFRYRNQEVHADLAARIKALKRYDQVFELKPLPFFEHENFRVEKDVKEANRIFEMIRKEYEFDGYDLIIVPSISLDDRVKFILNIIK